MITDILLLYLSIPAWRRGQASSLTFGNAAAICFRHLMKWVSNIDDDTKSQLCSIKKKTSLTNPRRCHPLARWSCCDQRWTRWREGYAAGSKQVSNLADGWHNASIPNVSASLSSIKMQWYKQRILCPMLKSAVTDLQHEAVDGKTLFNKLHETVNYMSEV